METSFCTMSTMPLPTYATYDSLAPKSMPQTAGFVVIDGAVYPRSGRVSTWHTWPTWHRRAGAELCCRLAEIPKIEIGRAHV